MTPDEYRKLALSFPGAVEDSHMDHPDFRVGGRIFATIWKDNGVIILNPDQQAELAKTKPGLFEPVKGGWGRRGSTTVHLEAADGPSVKAALSMAWRNKVEKRPYETKRRRREQKPAGPSRP